MLLSLYRYNMRTYTNVRTSTSIAFLNAHTLQKCLEIRSPLVKRKRYQRVSCNK